MAGRNKEWVPNYLDLRNHFTNTIGIPYYGKHNEIQLT